MYSQGRVKDVTIDGSSNPAARNFFQGAYTPDTRVMKVLGQAEEDFYTQKLRKR